MSDGEASAPVLVRAAGSPADWQAVRSLCCRTGNGGDPIDPARWPLFADLWIGPYQRLVPEWTYVALKGESQWVDTSRSTVHIGYDTTFLQDGAIRSLPGQRRRSRVTASFDAW